MARLVPAAVQAARDALEAYGTGGTAVNLHGHLSAAPELAAVAWPEESVPAWAAPRRLTPKTFSGTAMPLCPALLNSGNSRLTCEDLCYSS